MMHSNIQDLHFSTYAVAECVARYTCVCWSVGPSVLKKLLMQIFGTETNKVIYSVTEQGSS